MNVNGVGHVFFIQSFVFPIYISSFTRNVQTTHSNYMLKYNQGNELQKLMNGSDPIVNK